MYNILFTEMSSETTSSYDMFKKTFKDMSVDQKLQIVNKAIVYHSNKTKYGHKSWYSWRLHNWETKWNAIDPVHVKTGILFQTSWSAPIPVITALSQRFPNEIIIHSWKDDFDNSIHSFQYLNGIMSEYPVDEYIQEAFV